ncbi:unnamed protein product, partial [Mesorhabditis belari]|uniref:Amidase domain-containing protein n=1 Tax=Mesorhabditis belari TaxID=2138241 RepID=A0AAF3F664_9BILA
MFAYNLLRRIRPLLDVGSFFYFKLVNLLFGVIHLFTRKVSVPPPYDELLQISATQASDMIRKREITSIALVETFIRRIEQINRTINAVVLPNFDEARVKAREIDERLDEMGEDQRDLLINTEPLLGVPFTLKDCIEVGGLPCSNGIYSRRYTKAEKDATVVERLKSAGGIVLAVTNVPEVCMWWESVNTIYGRSHNPYDTRRITGGSSGGEAALVASAATACGVGSDIGGSIRMPAFFNGVFGLKPTPGIVPLEGHMPGPIPGYRAQMLRIGPICRFAEDLSIMLKVMGGKAAVDLRLDEPVQMRKLKIFYMEGLNTPLVENLHDDMKYSLQRAVKYFVRKYDLTSIRVDLPLAHLAVEYFLVSMYTEGEPTFKEHLADLKGSINCWLELMKWPLGKSQHTLPALITGLIDRPQGPFNESLVKELRYKRDQLAREIKELLGSDGILLFPSFPHTAPYHHQPLLKPLNFAYTGLFNALALPVVQCPMGLAKNGMPLGVQVVGAPGSDRTLIACAKDLEEGFGGWVPPTL